MSLDDEGRNTARARKDNSFFQSISTTISMFRDQIQCITGRSSRYLFPFFSHDVFHPCIMTKYPNLFNPSLKHSIMVLSSATPSRPIPKSIIPGLKEDVYYMIDMDITGTFNSLLRITRSSLSMVRRR